MQCPRCYFTNPAGTVVCEYCGARLEGAETGGTPKGTSAAKRQTMLGPMPDAPPVAKGPTKSPAFDPEDPFRIAARGVGAPTPVAPAPVPPPLPESLKNAPVVHRQPNRPTMLGNHVPTERAVVAGAAILIQADGQAHSIVLHEGRTRIGRRSDAEIHLDDPAASAEHALIRIEAGRAWLLDTSANGTTVAGVLCMNDRVDIVDDTVLVIGTTLIVVQILSGDTLQHLASLG